MLAPSERQILTVVETLEPVSKSDERMPPHMTIVPWFSMNQEQTKPFRRELTKLSRTAINYASGYGWRMFGWDETTPGMIMYIDEEGRKFQENVVEMIQDFGGYLRNYEWSKRYWVPHISDRREFQVRLGQVVQFDSLALYAKQEPDGHSRLVTSRQIKPYKVDYEY